MEAERGRDKDQELRVEGLGKQGLGLRPSLDVQGLELLPERRKKKTPMIQRQSKRISQ